MKSHQEEIVKMGNILKITYDGPKIKVFHSFHATVLFLYHPKSSEN